MSDRRALDLSAGPAATAVWAARWRRIGVAFAAALAFGVLTWAALFTVPGQNLDNVAMEAMVSRRGHIPAVLGPLTSLVSVPAVALVAVVVLGIAVARRRPALALRGILVVAGANITTQLLKDYLLWRPQLGVAWTMENSYPSGHTTFAASVAVALIIVAPRGFRTPAAAFGWVWTSLMGVVVIAQGWHRLSDVLGAVLLVGAWGYLCAPTERRRRISPRAAQLMLRSSVGMLLVGVLAAVGVFWRSPISLRYALSRELITDFVEPGTWLGLLAVVMTVFLVVGIAGVVMSAVDRLAGSPA